MSLQYRCTDIIEIMRSNHVQNPGFIFAAAKVAYITAFWDFVDNKRATPHYEKESTKHSVFLFFVFLLGKRRLQTGI